VSVTAARGFVANGGSCGIKPNGESDLALVATDDGKAVTAAAVFTSNKATAAPVLVSRAHLEATGGRAAAVVINSGNANAATGDAGRRDAERMCDLTAAHVGCRTEEVLVCSTGLIGFSLPMTTLEAGIPLVSAELDQEGGGRAAEAILTTDTEKKQVVIVESGFVVGGMAKGAAMLRPDMATMLAVLTSDATVDPVVARRALQAAVRESFNVLSVDGCQSTNDTVILLANGRQATAVDEAAFTDALTRACADLAAQMAGDAEGATKVIWVEVSGAASDADAQRGARAVAESQLVKCSFYGEDPYWGRVVSELGSAGIAFDPDTVSVAYGGTVVCRGGIGVDHDTADVRAHLARRHVQVVADLGLGSGTGRVLTNDLTPAYIDENMGTS
jgi:glutamate N-acetyltransferase/amino-acid N-acetyltransferase